MELCCQSPSPPGLKEYEPGVALNLNSANLRALSQAWHESQLLRGSDYRPVARLPTQLAAKQESSGDTAHHPQ